LELLGINFLPSIEISLKRKERIKESKSQLVLGYHEEKIALKLKEILSWIEPYGKICFLLSDKNSMFAYISVPALYYNQVENLFSLVFLFLLTCIN